MYVTERRTEGYHIEVGIDVEDQTALETCVDSLDSSFLAEELAISIGRSLQDSRVWIGLPAWVRVGDLDISTSELEDRSYHLRSAVAQARRGATLAGFDEDDTVTLLDRSEVIRRLYQIFQLVAHTEYAVRASVERTYESGLRLAVDDLRRSGSVFDIEADLGVNGLELIAYSCIELAEEFLSLSLVSGLDTDERVSFAGDSVVEVTATDLSEAPVEVLLESVEVAREELISVAEADVDLTTRVTALEARDGGTEPYEILRSSLVLGLEGSDDTLTAGTADEELTFVLAVEVDEDLTGEEAWLEGEGTGHTGLFVDGEEGFDRPVFDVVRGEDGELCSTADAVVSTEGGAVSMEPFAIDDGTDGVVVEVVHGTSVLLAYHVDVTLQDELDTVFVARGSRLAHDDVAHLILLVLDTVVLSELLEVSDDLLFLLRGAGDLCDLMEVLPDNLGVQLCNFHCFT